MAKGKNRKIESISKAKKNSKSIIASPKKSSSMSHRKKMKNKNVSAKAPKSIHKSNNLLAVSKKNDSKKISSPKNSEKNASRANPEGDSGNSQLSFGFYKETSLQQFANRPVGVIKTLKLFINGEFPRTESGRVYAINPAEIAKLDSRSNSILQTERPTTTHLCLASRKDLRNAVTAAQNAQAGWSKKSAYNRGQIFYRAAEMMESKKEEFSVALKNVFGKSASDAKKEVETAIDTWVHYAGWSDKYPQVLGSINPVSGPHHNMTAPESLGTVGLVISDRSSLSSIIDQIASITLTGNSCITILSEKTGVFISLLGEVLSTSDFPAGVINLLSGNPEELLPWLSSHLEVHGLLLPEKKYFSQNKNLLNLLSEAKKGAAENMKRVYLNENFIESSTLSSKSKNPLGPSSQHSLRSLARFIEYKTVWHPMGI